MAVAGNTGGAGGAKNVARAQRKPKPKRANVYVPPAALVRPVRPVRVAPVRAKPVRVAPQAKAYVSQGRAVEKVARQQAAPRLAAEATSVRKRAKRVEISALRKQTGGDRPIVVNRRAAVARARRAPISKPGGTQVKAIGETRLKGPQPLTSKPSVSERKIQHANVERAAKSKDVIYSSDPEVLKKAGFKTAGLADKIAAAPLAAAGNAPADVAELVTTTPTSTYELGKTLVTHPKKVPGMLAAPYKEFAKDPVGFASKRPVTTFAMFYPGAKIPGRALGAGARLAGKQTLKREAATLPGTALRQERVGSRSYFKRRAQEREDRGLPPRAIRRVKPTEAVGLHSPETTTGPKPRITATGQRKRVDEHFERRRKYIARAEAAAHHQAKRDTRHLSGDERQTAIAEHVTAAREQADLEMRQEYAREFGATMRPKVSHTEVQEAAGAHKQAGAAVEKASARVRETRAGRKAAIIGARLGLRRSRTTPTLQRLEGELRTATGEAARQKRAAATVHEQAPTVLEARDALKAGRRELAVLGRETQRRSEKFAFQAGRATERTRVLDIKHRTQARQLSAEADRLQTELAQHNQTLAVAEKAAEKGVGPQESVLADRVATLEASLAKQRKAGVAGGRGNPDTIASLGHAKRQLQQARQAGGRPHTPVQLEALRRRVDATQRRADAADQKLLEHHQTGPVPGTTPRNVLAALERRGGKDLEHAQKVRAKEAEIVALEQAHRGALTEARRAVQEQGGPAELRAVRDRVKTIEQAISAERKRTTGVPPREHDILISAIHEHEIARGVEAAARLERETARKAKGALRKERNQGGILDPSVEGRLFDTKQDAGYVVRRMNEDPELPNVKRIKIGDQHAVVPETVHDYMKLQRLVGTSQATYAKVLRASRQKFVNAVLPLSPKWLAGQVVEGLLRANVHAGGPIGVATGLIREQKLFNALEAKRPGLGVEFRDRALPGGHYGGQVQEFRTTKLHELFNEADDGKIGKVLAAAGRAGEKMPGASTIVRNWNRYTRTVFDRVNGAGIEAPLQRAMLGREVARSQLMERKLLGLSDKAIQDAVNGLEATETQVEFGRGVQRAYGQYSNFSKAARERNLHWTPFLPWYGNAVKFLFQVLPQDHPVLTAILADVNKATEEERKKMGLSLYGDNGKPLFMQGSIPVAGGKVIRIGHYTPFGIGETSPGESVVGAVLPQFAGTAKNLLGLEWSNRPLHVGGTFKGRPFTEPEKWGRAALTTAGTFAPGVGQASRITGVERWASGKEDAETLFTGPEKAKRLKGAVAKEFIPGLPTVDAAKVKKAKKKKKGGGGGLSLSGGSSGGGLSLGGGSGGSGLKLGGG